MGLGLNPNTVPDLFQGPDKKDLPIESLTKTDKTAYLNIDLKINRLNGKAVDAMTAVFAPDPSMLKGDVDILLWFHGDKSYWSAGHSDDQNFSGKSIQYYLTQLPLCRLREFILKSKKRNFVLVAPTLNDKTGASVDAYNPDKAKRNFNPGALRWDKTDAEAYLQQALNGVQKHMGVKNKLSIGNIVLAAHSGGGHLQSQMAQHFDGSFNKINEVWCFDSSYWGSDPFITWLKKGHTQPRLFMYSTGGTTGVSSSKILSLVPSFLGIKPPPPPPPKMRPARTPMAAFLATVNRASQALDTAEAAVWRGIQIALQTTKIDILIEKDPTTKLPAATDFSLAMFGGMAGGHYECIAKYFTTLVNTSRNLN